MTPPYLLIAACCVISYIAVEFLGVSPSGESVAASQHYCNIRGSLVLIYACEAAAGIILCAGLASEEAAYVTEDGVG